MNETLILAAILIPCLVIAIVFHEVAHGWMALALGDPTAKEAKRLTFNPIRHVDPVGTIVVPGALALMGAPIFGWAKPVPVDQRRLNNPRYGMMAVAAAGPGMNFLLALVAAIAIGLLVQFSGLSLADASADGAFGWAIAGLTYFIAINIFLALFNLLPIPPFDGSHIFKGLLPPALARQYGKLQKFGILLILGLVAITWIAPESGIIANVVLPPVLWVQAQYFAIVQMIAGL